MGLEEVPVPETPVQRVEVEHVEVVLLVVGVIEGVHWAHRMNGLVGLDYTVPSTKMGVAAESACDPHGVEQARRTEVSTTQLRADVV